MGNSSRRLKRALAFLQTAWSIAGITLVLVLLTEGGFRAFFTIRDRLGTVTEPDRRVLAEGYSGARWPAQHYRELARLEDRWEPYVYFRQKPFQGETIHVGSDGLRATWHPPSGALGRPGARPIKLLMLGGSSLWGFGARDDQTIPSLVARGLSDQGFRVEVKNLAEIGYTSTQELVALVRELQAGYRPDVVTFYDGVNDTTAAFLEKEAGLTTNEINRRKEFNLLQSPARLAAALASQLIRDSGSYRFAEAVRRKLGGGRGTPRPALADESMRSLSGEVVRIYEANVELAEHLGHAYGFRPLFFWQPIVFTKPVLVPFEREEALKYGWTERIFADVYARIGSSPALEADRAFRDLSGIFADTKELVYIDYCHTTETANARIAAEIAQSVIAAVERGPAHNPELRPGGSSDGQATVK
jgi:hypothetical protein